MTIVAQSTDPLAEADTLLADPHDTDAWMAAFRETPDWKGLVRTFGCDIQAKEAALIAAVKLSDELESS